MYGTGLWRVGFVTNITLIFIAWNEMRMYVSHVYIHENDAMEETIKYV